MKRLILMLSGLIFLCSCGSTTPPAISVSIAPSSSSSIDQGQTVSFTATASTGAVAWFVSGSSCTGSACGTIAAGTGTTATYTAPSSVTSNLSVTVTVVSDLDGTKLASAPVVVAPAPSITTTTLNTAIVGTAYSAPLAATGGTGTLIWSLASGTLPTGWALSSAGVISGTPTAAGTYPLTVKVTDASTGGAVSATKALTLTLVNPLAVTTTSASLPTGMTGTAYTATTLAATGGTTPITWSLASGSLLPAGLTLSSAGVISGTPTGGGTTSFTVTATDSSTPHLTQTQALSITVHSLIITTMAVPYGVVNTPYSTPLVATGGVLPLSWTVTAGTLPSGITLSTGGVLAGTPGSAGSASFTVTVTDSSTPTAQQISELLNFVAYNPLAITSTSLPAATVNTSYSTTLAASGGTGTYAWSIPSSSQGFPSGLTMSAAGVVSGTPTVGGTFNVGVTVTDTASPPQTKTQTVSIIISTPRVLPTGCTSGNESVLQGQYVFNLSGYNGGGPTVFVGGLTFDGSGGITAGEVDANGAGLGGPSHTIVNGGSSYYFVGPDYRGCAVITTSGLNFTTRFSLGQIGNISTGVAANGRIIEFDNNPASEVTATGQLLQVNSSGVAASDPMVGPWVWLDQGYDSTWHRQASAGVIIHPSGTSGVLTTGEEDFNDNGSYSHFTGVTGTYTAHSSTPDSGRFTGSRTAGSVTNNLVLYQASNSQILYITSDLGAVLAGELDLQFPGAFGGFGNSRLTHNAVFYQRGIWSAWIGVANADGVSSLTTNFFGMYNGVNYSGPSNSNPWGLGDTCTYTVATNGRVGFSGGGCSYHTGSVFYLTTTDTGVLLTIGDADVAAGRLERQSPSGEMGNESLSGNFFLGTDSVFFNAGTMPSSVGVISFNGSGGITTGTSYIDGGFVGGEFPSGWTLWNNATAPINSDGSFVMTLPSYCPSCTTYGVVIAAGNKFVIFEPMGMYGPDVPAILIGLRQVPQS